MSYAMLARKRETAPAAKAKAHSKAASSSLRIGARNGAFEQEADRVTHHPVAAQTPQTDWSLFKMRIGTPLQRKCEGGGSCECEDCKDKKPMQRKATSPGQSRLTADVPSVVNEVLSSPGQPLDRVTRSSMEVGFDAHPEVANVVSPVLSGLGMSRPSDPAETEAERTASLVLGHPAVPRRGEGTGLFDSVRVHADAKAGESARAVNAQAYTVGNHIVFAPGKYIPQTQSGQRLLAHELTHVVQQQAGCRTMISRFKVEDCDKGNPMETSVSVKDAHSLAVTMLAAAIQNVQTDPLPPSVVQAAANHFKLTVPPPASKSNDQRLWAKAKTALSTMSQADKEVTYECEPKQNWWNGGCVSGVEAISLWNIHLCPLWWKDHPTALERASILLHEWGHKWGKGVNRIFETYRFDKGYAGLSTEKRLQQPDAFMGFIYELWTGSPPNF